MTSTAAHNPTEVLGPVKKLSMLGVLATALLIFGSATPAYAAANTEVGGSETPAAVEETTPVAETPPVVETPPVAETPPVPETPPVAEPDPEVTTWPLYKIVYDSTIYELVGDAQVATALSFEKWQNVYKGETPLAASTDFVKYPWSATVYAVTFWPGGESAWMWTPLSFAQWQTAGQPAPRIAGWIKGSYYYQWGTSGEIFVEGIDGVNHKLTYPEWADSGFRAFAVRADEGFLKLTWAPEFARMFNVGTGDGRPLGYAEWQDEAFPTPTSVPRITGDTFYKDCGSATIWYAGPGMNRPVNFQEWQAAGSPEPTVRHACKTH